MESRDGLEAAGEEMRTRDAARVRYMVTRGEIALNPTGYTHSLNLHSPARSESQESAGFAIRASEAFSQPPQCG